MADLPMIPSSEVRSFRQLRVWQKSMDLAVGVHHAARRLPQEVRFELGREMRRSATSVPSNIAEGFARHSRAVYRSHVAVALGSGAELETQVELAGRLACIDVDVVAVLLADAAEVSRMVQGLWTKLSSTGSDHR